MKTQQYGYVKLSDVFGLFIVDIGSLLISFGMNFISNENIQIELYEKIKEKFDE